MSFLTLKFAILFNRFPSNIDFPKCRRENAASLNDSVSVGVNEKM